MNSNRILITIACVLVLSVAAVAVFMPVSAQDQPVDQGDGGNNSWAPPPPPAGAEISPEGYLVLWAASGGENTTSLLENSGYSTEQLNSSQLQRLEDIVRYDQVFSPAVRPSVIEWNENAASDAPKRNESTSYSPLSTPRATVRDGNTGYIKDATHSLDTISPGVVVDSDRTNLNEPVASETITVAGPELTVTGMADYRVSPPQSSFPEDPDPGDTRTIYGDGESEIEEHRVRVVIETPTGEYTKEVTNENITDTAAVTTNIPLPRSIQGEGRIRSEIVISAEFDRREQEYQEVGSSGGGVRSVALPHSTSSRQFNLQQREPIGGGGGGGGGGNGSGGNSSNGTMYDWVTVDDGTVSSEETIAVIESIETRNQVSGTAYYWESADPTKADLVQIEPPTYWAGIDLPGNAVLTSSYEVGTRRDVSYDGLVERSSNGSEIAPSDYSQFRSVLVQKRSGPVVAASGTHNIELRPNNRVGLAQAGTGFDYSGGINLGGGNSTANSSVSTTEQNKLFLRVNTQQARFESRLFAGEFGIRTVLPGTETATTAVKQGTVKRATVNTSVNEQQTTATVKVTAGPDGEPLNLAADAPVNLTVRPATDDPRSLSTNANGEAIVNIEQSQNYRFEVTSGQRETNESLYIVGDSAEISRTGIGTIVDGSILFLYDIIVASLPFAAFVVIAWLGYKQL